jgi:hypothetical protein
LHQAQGDTLFTLSDTQCAGGPCVRLSLGRSRQGYIVRLLTAPASRVTLHGQPLTQADSFAAWEAADRGWFQDATRGRLWVKFATDDAAATLEALR